MSKGKVLVIGSNATRIETGDCRTGATGRYINETVVPMLALIDAGCEMTVFSDTEEKVVEDYILHVKFYFNMIEALDRRLAA